MALCRPVPEINQLAAFTTKRPPGIVVPASEAFALRAGVGLGGFFRRGFVSHGITRVIPLCRFSLFEKGENIVGQEVRQATSYLRQYRLAAGESEAGAIFRATKMPRPIPDSADEAFSVAREAHPKNRDFPLHHRPDPAVWFEPAALS